MNTWAAVTGPIRNWLSSCGTVAVTSLAMGVFSSAISLLRLWMRLAVERRACLVAVSSLTGAGGIRNVEHLATRAVVFRPRSWSRRSTGAVTTRAFSWLMADTLAPWAPWRVVSNTRRASRSPLARGTDGHGRPSTWRAARRASRASVLAPSRVGVGWLNSFTSSPRAIR